MNVESFPEPFRLLLFSVLVVIFSVTLCSQKYFKKETPPKTPRSPKSLTLSAGSRTKSRSIEPSKKSKKHKKRRKSRKHKKNRKSRQSGKSKTTPEKKLSKEAEEEEKKKKKKVIGETKEMRTAPTQSLSPEESDSIGTAQIELVGHNPSTKSKERLFKQMTKPKIAKENEKPVKRTDKPTATERTPMGSGEQVKTAKDHVMKPSAEAV